MPSILRLGALLSALALALAIATTAQAGTPVYQVRAIIANQSTQWHTLGLANGALLGVDALDQPAPPPLPGLGFDAWLVMPVSPAGLPNRWLGDFRPANNSSVEVVDFWEFVVAAPTAGVTCRLEVRPVTPVGYGERLSLLPPTGGSPDLSMGGAFEWTLDSPTVSLLFELRTGTPVAVDCESWGSVKALFRR